MAFKATAEQAEAICAEGNVLVSAAAGSGKTAVLVERIVRKLIDRDNPVDADCLLVVTFTNAAAAEMKARIAQRIADEIKKNPKGLRLRRQKILLTKANISTIDSFCISLVREHFYELNLPADFKISDASATGAIERETLVSVIGRHLTESKDESGTFIGDFVRLTELLGADYGDQVLYDAVRSIYLFLQSLPFPEEYIERSKSIYKDARQDIFCDILLDFARDVLTAEAENIRFAIKLFENDAAMHDAWYEGYAALLNQLDFMLGSDGYDTVRELVKYFEMPKVSALRGYEDTEFKDKISKMRQKTKTSLAKLSEALYSDSKDIKAELLETAPYICLLLDIAWEFYTECSARKLKLKQLGFADVEHAALRLLVKKEGEHTILTDIGKALADKFSEVLVDEYQDTNDLQDAIFEALSDGGKKLFMVGDVKQCIYRFRLANPANFLKRMEDLPVYDGGAAGTINLSKNFRSRKEICDTINFVFSNIMSRRLGEIDYDERHMLDAGAAFPSCDAPPVKVALIPQKSEEKDAETEAAFIVEYIKKSMKEPAFIREAEGLRAARFGDFSVLMRSKTGKIQIYANALKRAGIPVWVDNSGGFLKAREIDLMLSLLKVIDNPLRDVPLLSVLMSGLFEFTADEIAKMRINSRTGSLFAAVLKSNQEKAKRFLGDLENFRDFAAMSPVGTLLRHIYEETGFLSSVLFADDGESKRANLLLLCDYADTYEQNGRTGLAGFLRYIEGMKDLNAASAVTEADDVVRLMTVHRSKGLQFPVCILAGLTSKFNDRPLYEPVLFSPEIGIGIKINDASLGVKYPTAAHRAISICNRRDMLSEEMRILYVAMTRAEDRLVIPIITRDAEGVSARKQDGVMLSAAALFSSNSFASWLLPVLIHRDFEIVKVRSDDESETILEPAEVLPDRELYAALQREIEYVYPYAQINSVAAKRTVSDLIKKEEPEDLTARPALLSASGLTSAEKGSAVHAFMQHADFEKAEKDVAAEAERLYEGGFLTQSESKAVHSAQIARFFQSDLYARMKRSETILREVRFMAELPATEIDSSLPEVYASEMVAVQGIADCVFYEEDGIVIVDYKTNRVKQVGELETRYRRQLALYGAALSKTLSKPVKSLILYSFPLHDFIEL